LWSSSGTNNAISISMDSGERLSLAICSIEMRFDPEDVDHAIRLLLSVRGSIQAKRGCRVGEVGMEASDPGADLLKLRENVAIPGALE